MELSRESTSDFRALTLKINQTKFRFPLCFSTDRDEEMGTSLLTQNPQQGVSLVCATFLYNYPGG